MHYIGIDRDPCRMCMQNHHFLMNGTQCNYSLIFKLEAYHRRMKLILLWHHINYFSMNGAYRNRIDLILHQHQQFYLRNKLLMEDQIDPSMASYKLFFHERKKDRLDPSSASTILPSKQIVDGGSN